MKRMLLSIVTLGVLLFTLSACSSPIFSDIPPELAYSNNSLPLPQFGPNPQMGKVAR